MKRVLLLGMILAILILAMPQGVLAGSALNNATVTASVTDYAAITAAFEPPVGGWNLTRYSVDDNLCPNCVNVTVDSSTKWGTTVADEKGAGATENHMVADANPWPALIDHFQIDGSDLSSGKILEANKAAQGPSSIPYNIAQKIELTDDTVYNYKIVLAFTLTSL